jgi:hypothetical protein
VFVYQIQAEGTLDQVVQARAESKDDVQDLLMDYCKMKSPVKGPSVSIEHGFRLRVGM